MTEKVVSGDNIFGGKGFSAASTNNFRSKSKVSFGGPAVTVNSAIISFGLTTIVKEVSSQYMKRIIKRLRKIFLVLVCYDNI